MARGHGAGQDNRASHQSGGNSRAGVEERRRVCLQSPLFRSAPVSGQPRLGDSHRLRAFACDARANDAWRERKADDAGQGGGGAPRGSGCDGGPVEVGQGCVRRALYLGVDGGATRSRARLRDAKGKVLAEATGAAANIHVDFVAAEAALRALVDATLTKAGLNQADSGSIAMGLGLAGFKGATDQTRIAAAFPGFSRVQAANDATTACVGAHAGADGGLIIAGTGSAAVARVGNKETIIGGRGFALGDDGSGSHIGLEAMRFAMRAYDRIGPESALTQDLISHFNNDPVAMMNWALSAKPGDFGGFAPRVFEHAASQDPIALKIVWAAAHALGVLTRGVFVLGAERVALVGGVGEGLRPYFEPDMAARLQPPLYDPTDGAILFVGGAVASEGQVAP